VIQYWLGESSDHIKNGEAWFAGLVANTSSTFIDVGANIGNWTAIFTASMPQGGKGILFEPSQDAVSKLRGRFSSIPNIEIAEAAVGDTLGMATFYIKDDMEKSSLLEATGGPTVQRKQVKVTTIDIEVKNRGWGYIDFLKVDTEGLDFNVMRGAKELLSMRKIGVLQFEYGDGWRYAGNTLAFAIRYLESFGYRVLLLKSEGLFDPDYKRYGEYFTYSNYVAVSPHKVAEIAPFVKGRI
jgi:FkbM family methyltransferase